MQQGFHCSESIVLFSLSFSGWSFLRLSGCLFLGLVCFAFRRYPAFCVSPVLLQTENSCPTTKRG